MPHNQFICFQIIINDAKRCESVSWVTPNMSASNFSVRHKSTCNNVSNSASLNTFDILHRSLSSAWTWTKKVTYDNFLHFNRPHHVQSMCHICWRFLKNIAKDDDLVQNLQMERSFAKRSLIYFPIYKKFNTKSWKVTKSTTFAWTYHLTTNNIFWFNSTINGEEECF